MARLPVVDLWVQPAADAARASQVLLGTPLVPLTAAGDYLYIEGPDYYRGWVRREETAPPVPSGGEERVVAELSVPVLPQPDAPQPQMHGYFGTRLPLEALEGEWARVRLPEGEGWVPASALRAVCREGAPLSLEALLADARRFVECLTSGAAAAAGDRLLWLRPGHLPPARAHAAARCSPPGSPRPPGSGRGGDRR